MFCNKDNINWDDFDGLRALVKSLVKEKRYTHILGVEEEAVKIAEIYNCGDEFIKKLKSAAILHDITKEFGVEKYFEILESYNIILSEDEKKAEWSLHAKTGAYIAKFEFGADDIIFNAIYNHTDISDLSKFPDLFNKILHLADWIEPNREDQRCIEVREYFYSKIEKAETLEQKYKILDETIFDFVYNI
ncbi:MAG: bis(5'-nucleosyl)-tetraphosphatase (symmetrical) YqeK [Oscillospiraceae bacterium]|nr:bis(5'-nucleosyl)-tetraphosphatase (symmetrical) YqeK [Oscillospiraceae bacterium]